MFVACLAILATLPGCCSEPKTKYICKLEISLVCRVCLQGKFACRNLLRFVENFYNYAIFFKAVVFKICRVVLFSEFEYFPTTSPVLSVN